MGIIQDLEAELKAAVIKYLDLNKDGHVTWADATYALGILADDTLAVIKAHAPELVALMTTAVTAAAGLTGDKRTAALAAVKEGAIALGRTMGADAALTDAAAIGQMFGVPENAINTTLEALVALGKKNQMVPSEATKQAVGLDAAAQIAPAQ